MAGWTTLAGLLGLIGADALPEGTFRRVVESVAAIVFAIGLVQVLSDVWLHTRLAGSVLAEVNRGLQEIRAEISLDDRLRPSGISSVERSLVDWETFLAGADEVTLVPCDVTEWLTAEWDALAEAARDRRISARVLLPNVNGPQQAALAGRFDVAGEKLADSVRTTVRTLRERWLTSQLRSGSRLRIETYDQPASFGLVIAEQRWALLIPPVVGPRPGRRPLTMLFEDSERSDDSYRTWAEQQIVRLDAKLFDQVDAR